MYVGYPMLRPSIEMHIDVMCLLVSDYALDVLVCGMVTICVYLACALAVLPVRITRLAFQRAQPWESLTALPINKSACATQTLGTSMVRELIVIRIGCTGMRLAGATRHDEGEGRLNHLEL